MSRSILAVAVTAAAAALMPQMPAAAQEPGIVVAAPRVPAPWQPKNTVRRDTVMRAQVWVPTADLDLRTRYGRAMLDYRARLAADQACYQLRLIEPSSGVGSMMNPDPQDCRQRAYHNARRDADYLIRASG